MTMLFIKSVSIFTLLIGILNILKFTTTLDIKQSILAVILYSLIIIAILN